MQLGPSLSQNLGVRVIIEGSILNLEPAAGFTRFSLHRPPSHDDKTQSKVDFCDDLKKRPTHLWERERSLGSEINAVGHFIENLMRGGPISPRFYSESIWERRRIRKRNESVSEIFSSELGWRGPDLLRIDGGISIPPTTWSAPSAWRFSSSSLLRPRSSSGIGRRSPENTRSGDFLFFFIYRWIDFRQ